MNLTKHGWILYRIIKGEDESGALKSNPFLQNLRPKMEGSTGSPHACAAESLPSSDTVCPEAGSPLLQEEARRKEGGEKEKGGHGEERSDF